MIPRAAASDWKIGGNISRWQAKRWKRYQEERARNPTAEARAAFALAQIQKPDH